MKQAFLAFILVFSPAAQASEEAMFRAFYCPKLEDRTLPVIENLKLKFTAVVADSIDLYRSAGFDIQKLEDLDRKKMTAPEQQYMFTVVDPQVHEKMFEVRELVLSRLELLDYDCRGRTLTATRALKALLARIDAILLPLERQY